MKLLIGIVSFIAGLVACYALFAFGILQRVGAMQTISTDASQNMSTYLSFVSVMLTAVTVVLAALAIGIGIIGAYTFSGLKTEARSTAQATAREISELTARDISADALSEVKIKRIVEAYLGVYVRERDQAAEWGTEVGGSEE
ncbi:putative membrane protein YqhA [Methylobacterium sp. OAE515]|uniref:hypothetical protein n=1 Tax=Methylobacterium sp. OAE515 TaxID=2817895 RepID=UPI00178B2F18